MRRSISALLAVPVALLASLGQARAQSVVESFDDPFDLERSWLSEVSDIANYYGDPRYRGNNPTGLWVSVDVPNPDDLMVTFEPSFGDTVETLSLDASCWGGGTTFYAVDMEDEVVFEGPCPTNKNTPVLAYPHHFEVRSRNGIRRFGFRGVSLPGNTAIDNVTVTFAPESQR